MIYLITQHGLKTIDPLYQTTYGISITQPGGYIVLYGVLGIFMALAAIFGNRGGCHAICWMAPFMIIGVKIGALLHMPTYGLKLKTDACVSCGKCTTVCPMSLDVEGLVHLGDLTHVDCISCAKCVATCPKNVLTMGISRP